MTRSCVAAACILAAGLVAPLGAQDGGVIFSPAGAFGQPPPRPLPGGDIPALCRMHFEWVDDDHSVLRMRAQPSGDGNFFHFRFHDNDTNRSGYYAPFEWWDFNKHRYVEPQQHISDEVICSGRCVISIPPIPPDREFGLSGFELEFLGGERFIRDIMIRPLPSLGQIVVNFRDNSTPTYRVQVSYVTFERGNWRLANSRSPRPETAPVLRRAPRGMKVLRGFRVGFLNGDHQLQEFEINVCNDTSLNGIFRDVGGTDDPYRLDVQFAFL